MQRSIEVAKIGLFNLPNFLTCPQTYHGVLQPGIDKVSFLSAVNQLAALSLSQGTTRVLLDHRQDLGAHRLVPFLVHTTEAGDRVFVLAINSSRHGLSLPHVGQVLEPLKV